jgi:hypothetical protein
VRDLVFIEGCGKINDETKEKLGFLTMTSNSIAGHDEVAGGHDRASRLNTISEAMDSTGKCSEPLLHPRMAKANKCTVSLPLGVASCCASI